MASHLFIVSDQHFGAGDDEALRSALFSRFCKSLPPEAELFVLGDFFDFWVEYSFLIRKDLFWPIHTLASTVVQGNPVTMVLGNHDFMRGTFLQEVLGIRVCPNSVEFSVDGLCISMQHGDKITGSRRYAILRAMLDNSFFQFLYRLLPPTRGISLAKKISRSSSKQPGSFSVEKHRKHVENLLDKLSCDVLVTGHTHVPDLANLRGVLYANCGTWLSSPTYVRISVEERVVELCCFDRKTDTLADTVLQRMVF